MTPLAKCHYWRFSGP